MPAISMSHIFVAIASFIAGGVFARRDKSSRSTLKLLPEPQATKATEPPAMSSAARLFYILFLGGWLTAWTAGMTMALGAFLGSLSEPGPHTIFLGGWLCAATAGWFFAAKTLIALLRGEDIDLRGRRF